MAVYGLSPLVNAFHGGIPFHWQHVMFWGGLRGALSMALALGLIPTFPERGRLVFLTFSVVLFSLLVQGLTIGPLLRRLGLSGRRAKATVYHRLSGERLACQAAISELERLYAGGMISRPVLDQLLQEYHQRLAGLETEIEALHLSDATLQAEQVTEARKLALLAEKSALSEAERSGLLDGEDLRDLMDRLDTQLAYLQAESTLEPAAEDAEDEVTDVPD